LVAFAVLPATDPLAPVMTCALAKASLSGAGPGAITMLVELVASPSSVVIVIGPVVAPGGMANVIRLLVRFVAVTATPFTLTDGVPIVVPR
jgi:hypothetical protein